jgi:hypothetical protein
MPKTVLALCTAATLTAFTHFVLLQDLYATALPTPSALATPSWLARHAKAFAAFGYHGSPLYCAAAALGIVSVATGNDPVSWVLGWVLTMRATRHIAKVRGYHCAFHGLPMSCMPSSQFCTMW